MKVLGLRHEGLGVWLLLAALLLFGSEILVWTNPLQRPIIEWLLLIPGYIVLSMIVLDFLVRYRVNDFFGVLLLAGIYSLMAAVVLNPVSTLNEMPRTLFTRVMGAHALIAVEMIGLFLAVTGSTRYSFRYLLIGCTVVGMAWGIWVRNWPIEEGFPVVDLPIMLMFGIGGILLIALLLYGLIPRVKFFPGSDNSNQLEILKLSTRAYGAAAAVVGSLLMLHLIRGETNGLGLVFCLLLMGLCWAILWFRGRKRGDTLLDKRFPPRLLPLTSFILSAGVFIVVGISGYSLPDIKLGSITPLTLIGLGFTAYGLAWLPTLSLVLGIQGYLRQLATRKF